MERDTVYSQYSDDDRSPKLMYGFHNVPVKILARFFVGIDKIILKFMWKGKVTKTAKKTFLKKKHNVGKITLILRHDIAMATKAMVLPEGQTNRPVPQN